MAIVAYRRNSPPSWLRLRIPRSASEHMAAIIDLQAPEISCVQGGNSEIVIRNLQVRSSISYSAVEPLA
jgi:hypothetical protein